MPNTDTILRNTVDELSRIKLKINNFLQLSPSLPKINSLIDESINILNKIIREKKHDYPELADKIYEKTRRIAQKLPSTRNDPDRLLYELKMLKTYIGASYYDFTGEIEKVRRAYKEFITAFTITIILIPIFFGFSILFIGFLIFPLFISIHAYRARRKLGLVISSALIPISLFICTQATLYMIYALMSGDEINRITSVLGVSPVIAYAIVSVIGVLGITGLILGLRSFITLYKSLDAFI